MQIFKLFGNKYPLSIRFFVLVIFCASFMTLSASHADHQVQSDLKLALSLENDFWLAVQKDKINHLKKMISSEFQGLSPDGPYDKKQQVKGLKDASLLGFGINNPVVTREGDNLIFSYTLVAIGNGITNGPNLSTWKKHHSNWKMISHSYAPFNPIVQ